MYHLALPSDAALDGDHYRGENDAAPARTEDYRMVIGVLSRRKRTRSG
jgi:hypothetical protein